MRQRPKSRWISVAADGTPDEPPDPVNGRRSVAVGKVDDFVVGVAGGNRLPAHVLDRFRKRGYGLGWRVPVNFSDGISRELDMLVDDDFPYTPPRIAVANGPGVLAWPHLEADGLLCILSSDAAVSNEDAARVMKYVLGEACRLIEDSITGDNAEDFRQEFLSYWELAADKGSRSFVGLLEPQGPGRRVSVWRGQQARIVGESPQALRRWLPRWGAKKGQGQDYILYDGVLIWLAEPLLPAEYPHTADGVRALARARSPEAVSVLEELAASGAAEIDVVVGAPTPHGACFAAITLRVPRQAGSAGRRGDLLAKGFRPGHVPRSLLIDRYLSGGAKVIKSKIARADHHWIHGRHQDPRQERLRHVRVAILGCGSVGGSLARLLAQAGVGNLLLVDPDIMNWPNVGRHELGAASVSNAKAPELAQQIEKAYPHLGEIAWRRERVGPKTRKLVGELASYDLIVSTMGNWAAESFLNDVHQESDDYPPILYGWLEPNAAAAHAVFVPRGGACFRCGMDEKGQPNLKVTNWPEENVGFQAPACGAIFTPYGPAELCWAHALLAEAAIGALMGEFAIASHRIWIGSRGRIEAAGGAWAREWVKEMGDPRNGGVTASRPWPPSSSCPVCIRRARAA